MMKTMTKTLPATSNTATPAAHTHNRAFRRQVLSGFIALGLTLTGHPLTGHHAQALKPVDIPSTPLKSPSSATTTFQSPAHLAPMEISIIDTPPNLRPPTRTAIPLTPTPSQQTRPTERSKPTEQTPHDPMYAQQWNLAPLNIPEAWALYATQTSTYAPVVAVLDTGFVASAELGNRAINGYDFVSDPERAADQDGADTDASGVGQYAYHAEAIANIIAAAHDDDGMAGIHPKARILHVRVADVHGMIRRSDLINGLRWAAGLPVRGAPTNPNPARIINLSLYVDFIPLNGCDARVQATIDEVTARGVLVIAGAANDGKNASNYTPAGCRNVLTVTSVRPNGQRPKYANWGRSVDIAAFGGEQKGQTIVAHSVLDPSGQTESGGTSMATPQVTAVASMLLSVRPELTPAQLRQLLIQNVTPFRRPCDPDPRKSCGRGLLNAEAALKAVLQLP